MGIHFGRVGVWYSSWPLLQKFPLLAFATPKYIDRFTAIFLSAERNKRGCNMERKLGEKSGEKVFILDPFFGGLLAPTL